MPLQFTFEETPDSGAETSHPPSYTLKYKAHGEFDDATVQAAANALTPLYVDRPTGRLYRQDVTRECVGWALHEITVPYGPLEKETGSFSWSFDTTGATINVKAAKEHKASYPSDGDYHKGAIGVKGDGDVEGTEIVIPALKLTYTYKHPAGVVTEARARALAGATGKTNMDEWRGFSPGELLFIGGSGSDGTDAEAEEQLQMIASQNIVDLSIGEITGIALNGHDVLWIEFTDEVEGGEPMRQPKRVHIERVYDPISFYETFGFN